LDDAIGLKKELRMIGYFRIAIVVLITIRMLHVITNSKPIVAQIIEILLRLCWFGINYMSTGWVVHKFEIILYRKSNVNYMESSAISLSTSSVRKIVYESTIRLLNESINGEFGYEQNERLQMQRVLSDHTMFDAFMRRLLKEYSYECLLSIIEMTQFKNRIFNEKLNKKQRI